MDDHVLMLDGLERMQDNIKPRARLYPSGRLF